MSLTTYMLGVPVFFAMIVADFVVFSVWVLLIKQLKCIPLALVGYEIVIANSYPTSASGIIIVKCQMS